MSPSKLRIYHKLQVAAHRLQKAADRAVLAASGVTTAQAAVLSIVAHEAGATQRSIARQLGLNESAVTAMATRLISLGLLERRHDRSDARAWKLLLTPKGRTTFRRIGPAFHGINERIASTLTGSELAALADSLVRLGGEFAESHGSDA